jgi:hypothetical protein
VVAAVEEELEESSPQPTNAVAVIARAANNAKVLVNLFIGNFLLKYIILSHFQTRFYQTEQNKHRVHSLPVRMTRHTERPFDMFNIQHISGIVNDKNHSFIFFGWFAQTNRLFFVHNIQESA